MLRQYFFVIAGLLLSVISMALIVSLLGGPWSLPGYY